MLDSMENRPNINFDIDEMSGIGPEYYQRRQEINNSLSESGLFSDLNQQFQEDNQEHKYQIDLGSLDNHEIQEDPNACAIACIRTMAKIAYPNANIPSESELIELAKKNGYWEQGLNGVGALMFQNLVFKKPLPTISQYAKEINTDKYSALFTAVKDGYAAMIPLSIRTLQQSLSKLNGEDVVNPRYDGAQHALIVMGTKVNQDGRQCLRVFDPSAKGIQDVDMESIIEEWSRYGFLAHSAIIAKAEPTNNTDQENT